MHISHIQISKILGIDELEFKAGKFTQVCGKNGEGKTSVLEAIKAATQGGTDATLLRKGEEKGQIVLVLDDGTEISKRVGSGKSTTTITKDGEKSKRPGDYMKSLTDLLSVNPIDFLRAPKKDRVRVLLESMPLTADTDKLTELSGIPVTAQDGLHALVVIDLISKQVYDDRTGTNRAVKEKEGTINQLQLAMPDPTEGVPGSEDEIRAELDSSRETKDAELERVKTKLDGIRADSNKALEKIKADAQAKIDAIREETQAQVAKEQERLSVIEGKAGQQRENTIAKFNEASAPLETALGIIRTCRESVAKREQAMATVSQMEQELEDLKTDVIRQTKALNDINDYKLELLRELPIPGLEVIDGELFRDGIESDRLNTAQQVDIAVDIAKLRAGDLKICCVDGVELLDTEAFEAFRQRAIESDLQLFVSRVTDEEFNIKTDAND